MFALICMCGGLGAVTRFVLNTSIQRWWNRAFPLSTFIINVLATFFAGVAAAAYFYQTADHSSYLLFVTGFLGGFSTFSTAINEMVSLARSGKYAAAAVYFMMTVLVPVVCVVLGWGLIAHVIGHAPGTIHHQRHRTQRHPGLFGHITHPDHAPTPSFAVTI